MIERIKRLPKGIFVIVLVTVLAVGGAIVYRASGATGASAANVTYSEVVNVRQGSVSSSVSVVGQLEAVQSADLYFDKMTSSTKLLTLQVKAGNVVTAGQVLATIDPVTYQQAVDQAESNLQSAQEKLADLQEPATAVEIAKADVAIAQAETDVRQAQLALANVAKPDNSTWENALKLAELNLQIAQLQSDLAQHDSTAKTERDLLYAVDWHARKISDLQDLVAHGQANLEQTNQVATEEEALAKATADLAVAQVKRQASLATASANLAAAKEALKSAQADLATAQAGGATLTEAKARLTVQSAEVALATAKSNKADLVAGADAVTLAAAKADVDKKRLSLADAQTALAATKLTAPFAGKALQTNATVGNVIGASTKILTMADLATLQVSASVDETTIKKLTQGQPATVTFDALAGTTITGTVGEIPLQGTLQNSVMVYQVPVTLPGADKLPLLVGMTANVRIQSGSAQNALLVPATAITRSSSGYTVMKVGADGTAASATSAQVEIGISSGTYTQITKGLSIGDKVVVKSTATTTTQNQQRGGFSIFGFGMSFGR